MDDADHSTHERYSFNYRDGGALSEVDPLGFGSAAVDNIWHDSPNDCPTKIQIAEPGNREVRETPAKNLTE